MSEKVSLSPAQVRAVAAIMATRTVTAAAAEAKVTTKTIYRWLADDPAFSAALAHAEGDMLATTSRAILAVTLTAVDTLKTVLEDPEASHGVRVRAADLFLTHATRLYELRTLEARLTALELEVLHDREK